ncbi:hypothetical protein D1007_42657 [Hordeum vulgare]|nr:hypothetical protein D1007_42657 [Hordeum vulgare]
MRGLNLRGDHRRSSGFGRWRTSTPTAPSASFCADEPSVLRRFNETLDFELVASRDGLVVLHRLRPRPLFGQSIEEGPPGSVLRVCYSFTGAVSVLPSVSIRDYRKHALLSVKDNSRAFELLVADECLRI